jgi:hypothetical protein
VDVSLGVCVVRYERTVCFCLVVYCFLNIAKCAEEKKNISNFLTLTAHSKMETPEYCYCKSDGTDGTMINCDYCDG